MTDNVGSEALGAARTITNELGVHAQVGSESLDADRTITNELGAHEHVGSEALEAARTSVMSISGVGGSLGALSGPGVAASAGIDPRGINETYTGPNLELTGFCSDLMSNYDTLAGNTKNADTSF